MKKSIFIIALAAGAMACNNNGKENNNPEIIVAEQKAEAPSLASDLSGKEWILIELNGKPVSLDTSFPQKPYLTFEKDNRVSGNLELKPGNGIKISEISATRMACPNLEVEQGFLDALQKAKSFVVENNTLTLSNDKKEPIARLQTQ